MERIQRHVEAADNFDNERRRCEYPRGACHYFRNQCPAMDAVGQRHRRISRCGVQLAVAADRTGHNQTMRHDVRRAFPEQAFSRVCYRLSAGSHCS